MKRRPAVRIVSTLALLFGTAMAVLSPGTDAAPIKKAFTVGLVITDNSTNTTVSSAALKPSADYTFVFTVTNTSKGPQYYGSSKILVPTGYTASPQSATSVTGFTAQAVTGGILVTSSSGSGIAPGAAVAVTATVHTPSSSCNAEWTTFVKQSNDFLGTGNDFMVSGPQPTTTVGTPHLTWTSQPGPAEYDVAMSPAPVVTAFDPCGNPVTSPVTVTVTDEAAQLASTATTSVATSASNGQASFGNLKFATFGFYDRLTATASGFTPDTSDWFIVAEKVEPCDTTSSCDLDLGTKSSTFATVTTGTGAAGQFVSGSRLPGTSGTNAFTDCTAQEGGNVQVSDTMIVDTPRAKEVSVTIAKALVNAVSNNGTPFMDICLDIPEQAQTPDNAFVTKSGTVAYQGLLPDCVNVSNVAPCVVSRNKRAANEIIVFDLPAGDPHFGAY